MRSLEACPHRDPTGADGGPSCRLVAEVAGVQLPGNGSVDVDACRACCASPVPDPRRINPVVASLISNAAEAAERSGGVPGCDPVRASGLRRWANKYLVAAGPDASVAYQPPRLTQSCHFLGESISDDQLWRCRHPAQATTTRDGCLMCRDWTDRPRPAPLPLVEILPSPPRQGPEVRKWAVGVTAAPRGTPTLDWTLDSLVRAGWDEVRVFEDLPTPIAPRHAGRPLSTRTPALGAWPNYYLALAELVLRHPEADAYLMVQDDVLFYDRQDLRGYLEQILWPSDSPCLISLYCSSAYTRPGRAWHQLEEPWLWGALAFLFPRDLARKFIADPWVLSHRWAHPESGLVAIDVMIGAWADRFDIPVYFPCPSLVQHIGAVSTLWMSHRLDGHRQADRFLADEEFA